MLNQLIEYSRREGIDAEPGFTTRSIKWLVEIKGDGKFVNVVPGGDENQGEQVSKCPEMGKMNAGNKSHFLIETLQTAALFFRPGETDSRIKAAHKKHNFFKQMIVNAAASVPGLVAVEKFLADENELKALRLRLDQIGANPTDWIGWRVEGLDPLKDDTVLNWWREWRALDLNNEKQQNKKQKVKKGGASAPKKMLCFLTGAEVQPLKTQPKIKGLSGVGGLGTGDVMAGFDKASFCSFGLKQAENAAMGEKPVVQYVEGLNHLIKNHSRKLANVLVVHWFKESVAPEDDPLSFLHEPPETTEGAALGAAREILEALRTGKRPAPPHNRFFAITLSGASGRVMVRDWMEGGFDDLVIKIDRWFSDLEIIARQGGGLAPEPKFMAVCGSLVHELKDLSPPIVATLWRVAVGGLPIPQPFVAQALTRFRSDIIEDNSFNHARMGLLKAYFIRKGDRNMSKYLNKEHPDPAYQCGRLLAILAELQRSALGDVGAGVVQRYYVSASQTPGLTLGRLIANSKNHLNKLEGGLAHWYESHIAEIMSRIPDKIPGTLDLEGQSLFALGYYQQIAAPRAERKNNSSNE